MRKNVQPKATREPICGGVAYSTLDPLSASSSIAKQRHEILNGRGALARDGNALTTRKNPGHWLTPLRQDEATQPWKREIDLARTMIKKKERERERERKKKGRENRARPLARARARAADSTARDGTPHVRVMIFLHLPSSLAPCVSINCLEHADRKRRPRLSDERAAQNDGNVDTRVPFGCARAGRAGRFAGSTK